MSASYHQVCAQEFEKMSQWVVLISIVPLLVSLLTVILICSSLRKMKKMVSVCDGIATSAHWLSRTAVRAGVGDTARSTIAEYAKTKPELGRLLK
ncbi:unnamed protein product [Caenorhabditis sp. 36 PRJEB53466]|nr:unnamed protein product [Caenorhabditis sp. 36 PRJEB53466]